MIGSTLTQLGGILAESDEGNSLFLLALGPLGGAATWGLLWRYYRNTDKSHAFERETRVEARQVTGDDRRVDEIKGTRDSRIKNENGTNHRKRVNRFSG